MRNRTRTIRITILDYDNSDTDEDNDNNNSPNDDDADDHDGNDNDDDDYDVVNDDDDADYDDYYADNAFDDDTNDANINHNYLTGTADLSDTNRWWFNCVSMSESLKKIIRDLRRRSSILLQCARDRVATAAETVTASLI